MSGSVRTEPRRDPYTWVTHLAKAMGSVDPCLFALWFRSRFKHEKYEEEKADLVRWNAEHAEMMRKRRAEMEREGFFVTEEAENEFKLKGQHTTLAGKPDLVGRLPNRGPVLIVDGKTGRERDSDKHQVLIYLWAMPRQYPDLKGRDLEGELEYKKTGDRVTLTPDMLDEGRMVQLLTMVGSQEAPSKAPSRDNCRFCQIGPWDCPQRVGATQPVMETTF